MRFAGAARGGAPGETDAAGGTEATEALALLGKLAEVVGRLARELQDVQNADAAAAAAEAGSCVDPATLASAAELTCADLTEFTRRHGEQVEASVTRSSWVLCCAVCAPTPRANGTLSQIGYVRSMRRQRNVTQQASGTLRVLYARTTGHTTIPN